MNMHLVPAFIVTAVFSANAFAHHGWDDEDRWEHREHYRVERVIEQQAYEAPVVIYEPAPVVYRDRIIYRDRPVYYEAAPRYYEQPAAYGGGNRVVGQTLGAIAGGALGSQLGKGNGRIAATAIGAVVGSVFGGDAAGR